MPERVESHEKGTYFCNLICWLFPKFIIVFESLVIDVIEGLSVKDADGRPKSWTF